MKARRQTADAELLQGTWRVAALQMDGQEMPAGMLAAARIVLEGDRFQSLGMGATYEGTLTLDPVANPKAFDLIFTAGPEKGNRSLGIYELAGDSWKICLTTRGGARPLTFSAEPGTGYALETLQRGWTAPSLADIVPAAGSGPVTELEGEWSMASGRMDGHPIDRSLLKLGGRR